jgi:hypothetical protein
LAVNYNPRIVTDGLFFCVDAGNPKSYPGSGTTWTNVAGSGSITLTNMDGTNFNSDNGGSLDFNGTDQYASTISIGLYTPYCIDIWFYNDDNITSGIVQQLCGAGTYPGGITLGGWTSEATNETFSFFGANPYTSTGLTYIRDTASSGIHNIVVNWNGSTYDIWLDGTKRTTYASPSYGHCTLHSRNGFALGSGVGNPLSYGFDGKIYSARIYTSQLSDGQVQQNFNVLRVRFGI